MSESRSEPLVHKYRFTVPDIPWKRDPSDRGEVIAIIPARGGSKGFPNKNLQLLADGRTLIRNTVETALLAKSVQRVVVSTDSPEIGWAAGPYAEVIHRPAHLSADWSPSEDALIHVLTTLRPEIDNLEAVVMLQCTSPTTTPEDIDACVDRVVSGQCDSMLSVVPRHQFVWMRNQGGRAHSVSYNPVGQRPRRQDAQQYVENGAVYVFRPWVLETYRTRLGGNIGLHVMHQAGAGIEIDSEEDLALLNWIITSGQEDRR